MFGESPGAIRETDAAGLMGLSEHLDETTVLTRELQVIKVLALRGLDPHTAADNVLIDRYRLVAETIRRLASDGVTLKFYICKRRVLLDRADTPAVSALAMTERYRDALDARGVYALDLYLSIERSARGVEGLLASRFRSPGPAAVRASVESARAELDEFARSAALALAPFAPRPLGTVMVDGRRCSEIAGFFNYLLETRHRDIEIGNAPLWSRMGKGRILYPALDHIEFRLPADVVYGAMLGIAEYPDSVKADVLLRLFWTPADFVACIGWRYVSREFALEQARRQRRKLVASEDDSVSQVGEIASTLDDAVAGRVLLGRSWFAVLALGRGEGSSEAMTCLNRGVGQIERALNDQGFAVAREDLAIACSHWAMFPGCWRFAPRVVTVTNRNFAALIGPHNAARGPVRTRWGPPFGHVETAYGVPHRLALHAGDLGNAIVLGPSGSGKTVLLGWLLAHASALGANVILFDKDRGAERAITGLGGKYVTFHSGRPTGMSPLRTSSDRTFLRRFIGVLLGDGLLAGAESPDLEAAVQAVLAIPQDQRRLRHVVDALDPAGEGFRQLSRWVRDGEYAWVFDNEEDDHALDRAPGLHGFDIGPFLDNDELRAPVLYYLFHQIDRVLGTAPTLIAIDEFWRVLGDPTFAQYVRDRLATIRKMNGAVVMATQSLSEIIESNIWRTVVEQTPTKIFFGNRAGRDEEYVGAFGLNGRESEIIRNLPPRCFLLRRGEESTVCKLDLESLDDVVELMSAPPDPAGGIRREAAAGTPETPRGRPTATPNQEGETGNDETTDTGDGHSHAGAGDGDRSAVGRNSGF